MFLRLGVCMARSREKSYRHILKYTGIFGGVEVLKILIGLIRNKLVAVILGPNGMGLISLLNSTIQLMHNSTNMGIPTSAIREISDVQENGDRTLLEETVAKVRTLALVTAVIGTLLTASLCRVLNNWTFTWGDHTLHFVLLSPIVGVMALTGVELSILKGIKQLRALARLSVYGVLVALVISIPLFYFFGQRAIVPVLLLTESIQLCLIASISLRLFPLRLCPLRGLWQKSRGVLSLGAAFVVSGIFVSGADFLIRTYLNNIASLDEVGLFNAGFVIVSIYGGMVFNAMGTDYFPRLSAVANTGREMNKVVSEQIEVSVLMVAPMLVGMMIIMPILLPALYSDVFAPVVGMVQIGLLALLFRAVYIPIEFISMARSNSMIFLLQDSIATLFLIGCVIGGYHEAGLWGAGLGLTIAYLLEAIFVLIVSHAVFGYVLSRRSIQYLFVHLLIGLVAYAVTFTFNGLFYWLIGALCILVSAGYSFNILRNKAAIIDAIKRKL